MQIILVVCKTGSLESIINDIVWTFILLGVNISGKIIKHKWENCMTVDTRAWTHRRNIQIQDVMTIEKLVAEIAETVRYYMNRDLIKPWDI